MKYTVVKSFPYSPDGVSVLEANVGETVEIPKHLEQGLLKEGFIAVDGTVPPAEGKSVPWAPENKAIAGASEQQVVRTAPEDKEIEYVPADSRKADINDTWQPGKYEAKETGAGWFAIFKDDVELDGLKKFRADEAGKFNAMSSQEKAEHVAEELAKD
jgi:hypothetical protein